MMMELEGIVTAVTVEPAVSQQPLPLPLPHEPMIGLLVALTRCRWPGVQKHVLTHLSHVVDVHVAPSLYRLDVGDSFVVVAIWSSCIFRSVYSWRHY